MKKRLFILFVLFVVVSLMLPAVAGAEGEVNPDDQGKTAYFPLMLGQSGATSAITPLEVTRISIAPQTGRARFLWLAADEAAKIQQQANSPDQQVGIFLAKYGFLFGVKDAATELVLDRVQVDYAGTTHFSYSQVYQGVPVFAGVLRIHFDANNLITTANGIFIPGLILEAQPSLTAAEAEAIALAEVNAAGAAAVSSALYVYRANLVRGMPGTNHLTYQVEVNDGKSVREFVFVDAHTGLVVDRLPGIYEDLTREIFNQVYDKFNPIWVEGDELPFYSEELSPEINQDVNRVLNFAEDTYQLVENTSGGTYLSYDEKDATMLQVVDVQTPDWCPNASWNGMYVQYCQGLTGDDTVAHEWGHAYTQHTSNLVYTWQSGALNESYSDIFGEVVDMVNGDEGLNEGNEALRTVGACSIYTPPAVVLRVQAPETIAGDYKAGIAAFGPPVDGTLEGDLMIVDDGSGDTSSEGCSPLINGEELNGKIAFIRRGNCTFALKVKNAQDAGAIGAIVANHQAGGDTVLTMAGDDPTITIQSLFIGYTDGNTIQAEIEAGNNVNVLFALAEPLLPPEDSYRWLSGEDDQGGAIRDLWNPLCYANPDKVTSEDYTCGTEDGGGVHHNSGVPNHAFALLVDGGTFNDQTISGIGLTKAFQIYWRAQYVYQTPTTIFPDHADALEEACNDLTQPEAIIFDLATGEVSTEVISETDCAELTKVIAAVELRVDPVCTGTPHETYRHRWYIKK